MLSLYARVLTCLAFGKVSVLTFTQEDANLPLTEVSFSKNASNTIEVE